MCNILKSDLIVSAGRRIRRLRLVKGLNQKHVAKALGITISSYSKIESGITDINFSRLAQIAEFHEVDIPYLLSDNAELECAEMTNPMIAYDEEILLLRKKVIALHYELFLISKKSSGDR